MDSTKDWCSDRAFAFYEIMILTCHGFFPVMFYIFACWGLCFCEVKKIVLIYSFVTVCCSDCPRRKDSLPRDQACASLQPLAVSLLGFASAFELRAHYFQDRLQPVKRHWSLAISAQCMIPLMGIFGLEQEPEGSSSSGKEAHSSPKELLCTSVWSAVSKCRKG